MAGRSPAGHLHDDRWPLARMAAAVAATAALSACAPGPQSSGSQGQEPESVSTDLGDGEIELTLYDVERW